MARTTILGALALAALTAPGCTYLKARARDFSQIVRLQVGGGVGLGASVSAGGAAHLGLGGGVSYRNLGVGLVYGEAYAFERSPDNADGEMYFPLTLLSAGDLGSVGEGFHTQVDGGAFRDPDRGHRHACYGLLPGLIAWEPGGTNLWTPQGIEENRWAHIHAFDCEASVYLGVLVVRAGVSPGELVDFVLGLFGLDPAGDDDPAPESRRG